jgi:hypothetical protein
MGRYMLSKNPGGLGTPDRQGAGLEHRLLETIFPTKTGWSCPTGFTPSLPMWKAHSLYLDATFTNKKVSGTNHSGMEM